MQPATKSWIQWDSASSTSTPSDASGRHWRPSSGRPETDTARHRDFRIPPESGWTRFQPRGSMGLHFSSVPPKSCPMSPKISLPNRRHCLRQAGLTRGLPRHRPREPHFDTSNTARPPITTCVALSVLTRNCSRFSNHWNPSAATAAAKQW